MKQFKGKFNKEWPNAGRTDQQELRNLRLYNGLSRKLKPLPAIMTTWHFALKLQPKKETFTL